MTGMIQYFQITRKWKIHRIQCTITTIFTTPPKKLHPRISFRVKKTDIDNKYDLSSRKCVEHVEQILVKKADKYTY